MDESEIKKFFHDQTIFITGGTGFVGKVLIEKLLRLCEVSKIYILVRPKKGKTTKQRFNEFFDYPCFDRIRNGESDLTTKVVFVSGDCESPNLGISDEFKEVLLKETTILFHAAADVRFDQPLQIAAKITIGSTRDVLALAKQMPRLKAFVYVSTAYSNCPHRHIGEEFYAPPMTSGQLLNIVDAMDEKVLDQITPKLLGRWPNTYTFTKSIAEDLIKTEAENLPLTIVRPAIVTPTLEEPLPGWIDNFYGISGIITAASLGILRSLNAKLNVTSYAVPCDYVANITIASAWNVAKEKRNNIPIYNYVGPKNNTTTWGKARECMDILIPQYPPKKMIWHYTFQMRENALWHKICIFFFHTVVAYLVDFVLICSGRKPMAVKNYGRINKLVALTSYFTTNEWTFDIDNVEKLWEEMGDSDKKLFNFNMDDVDLLSYFRVGIIGGRIYLLKDPIETIPEVVSTAEESMSG